MRREQSVVEQLVQNRSSFYVLKLQWEVDDVYELSEAISRNRTIQYVFLYDNFLASLSLGGRKEILNAIACLKNLESLVYVSNSNRVKIPINPLSKIVRCCKRLTTFELHGPNLVGDADDFQELSENIGSLPALRSFKLLPAYFVMGSVDLDPLFRSLARLHTLEQIRVCLYCDKGSRLSWRPLQDLCKLELLKILDLRWPYFCDEHLTIIAKGLHNNVTLEELRIGGNNLSYSCFSIAEMVEHNVGLRRLSLACRGLGNRECLKALWQAIDRNAELREVTFENTDASFNRGEETAEVMEKVLAENHSLHTLRLLNMGLDDDSCLALARGLLVNRTLRELDLRKGNKLISHAGYKALATMLQQNYSLYALHTNASGPIKDQIEVCLRLNKSADKLEKELAVNQAKRSFGLFQCCSCR